MAMNFAEAQSMVNAAKAATRTLGVAYYRRAYPKVSRASELLRQGAIGRLVLAYASSHGWFEETAGGRDWLLDPARAGGGPLFDIGSHRIDLMNYLFGAPQKVSAHLSNAVRKFAVEDCATVMIEYHNKVRGLVDVRWHSRVKRDEFRIIGTGGEMDLTPLNGGALVYPGGWEDLPPHPNLHFPCIQNFVNAVLDRAELLSSGESALATDWIIGEAVAGARA